MRGRGEHGENQSGRCIRGVGGRPVRFLLGLLPLSPLSSRRPVSGFPERHGWHSSLARWLVVVVGFGRPRRSGARARPRQHAELELALVGRIQLRADAVRLADWSRKQVPAGRAATTEGALGAGGRVARTKQHRRTRRDTTPGANGDTDGTGATEGGGSQGENSQCDHCESIRHEQRAAAARRVRSQWDHLHWEPHASPTTNQARVPPTFARVARPLTRPGAACAREVDFASGFRVGRTRPSAGSEAPHEEGRTTDDMGTTRR